MVVEEVLGINQLLHFGCLVLVMVMHQVLVEVVQVLALLLVAQEVNLEMQVA